MESEPGSWPHNDKTLKFYFKLDIVADKENSYTKDNVKPEDYARQSHMLSLEKELENLEKEVDMVLKDVDHSR